MIKLFIKCTLLILSCLVIAGKVEAQLQKDFILKGKIEGKEEGNIYLVTYNEKGERLLDSSKIINEKFTFKGEIFGYSDVVYLKLNPKELRNQDALNALQFQMEDSKMYIQLKLNHFSKYVLKGCKSCRELSEFEESLIKLDSLNTLLADEKIDVERKKAIEKLYDSFNLQNFTKKKNYIVNHPNSKIAPFLLYWAKNNFSESNFSEFIKIFNALDRREQESYYGLRCQTEINEYLNKAGQVGKPCPDFSGVSLKGDTINFKEFAKHKLTLLDFWASWCVPCRKGNPVLKSLYKNFHSLGFEIIGISDDAIKDRNKWINAIEHDGISEFTHLLYPELNTVKWDNANGTSNLFFNALPTRILVNQEGVIIGRYDNESTEELVKKIRSVYEN